jgi:hypothetical protein
MKLLKILLIIIITTAILILGTLLYIKYVHYPRNPHRFELFVVKDTYNNKLKTLDDMTGDLFLTPAQDECMVFCSEDIIIENCTDYNEKYKRCEGVCEGARKTTCSGAFDSLIYKVITKIP